MADNVTLNAMSGGVVVAADDVSSVFFQKIKIALGGDGVEGNLWDGKIVANSGVDIGDVTINNGSGVNAVNIQDGGNSITVDGTVAVTNSDLTTIAGAVSGTEVQVDIVTIPTVTVINSGTFAVQSTNQANSGVDIGDVTINNGAGASAVNIQDGGNSITVDGTITVEQATSSSLKAQVQGLQSANAVVASNPVLVGGTDGTNARIIKTDTSGELQVDVLTLPSIPAGTNAIGKLAANDAVDIGDVTVNNGSGASAVNIQDGGNSITVDNGGTFAVQNNASSTLTGCDIFRSLDLDESEEDVKTSAGNVYGFLFHNKAATTMWLKFYNATAASTTVGSTTPVITWGLPAGASGIISFPYPVAFATAICVAVTTGIADADTGAPAANDVSINIFYK